MKLEGLPFTNGPTCQGVSFSVQSAGHDLSIITINGRYPETGTAMNNISHEIVYIAEGEGEIVVEGVGEHLKAGDVVSVAPHTKFFWQGQLKLIMSCQPAFTPEQYVLE